MGDRTYVTLTVLEAQAKEAEKYFDDSFESDRASDPFHYYTFSEVNYGELPFLHALRAAGIAYTSNWDAGSEYNQGFESCRFTSTGDIQTMEVGMEFMNPDLDKLMAVLEDHAALKTLIVHHHEMTVPLPWDNQIEYGKLYRTHMLITT